VGQLREELAERDKVIIDLLHRVKMLENSLQENTTSQELTDIATPVSGNEQPEDNAPARGALEVDALAAERALERSLVQQGARLMRPGQIEIAPTATYSRLESPSMVALSATNQATVTPRVERDILDWNLSVRVGLPFDAQLEANMPYRTVHRSTSFSASDGFRPTETRTGSGLGDLTIGLAKQISRNYNWQPSVVARAVWITGAGEERADGVSLGTGSEGIGARLSAYWRNDPLVFLMTGGYTHYLDDDLRPGDRTDFSLGTALAVSPETALTFSLDQSYSKEFERKGRTLPGTDSLSSVLNITSSTILGRGLLLRVNAGVGLTNDAPDYRLGFSLPFRWNRH
jgi:hypothetical protein